jgi:hypothetical protein
MPIDDDNLRRSALLKLVEINDSDIRIDTLQQGIVQEAILHPARSSSAYVTAWRRLSRIKEMEYLLWKN